MSSVLVSSSHLPFSFFSLPSNRSANGVLGSFLWDGVNFADSAQDVHFAIEGGGEVPVLRATLINGDGEGVMRDLNLSERISNYDGNFAFSE
jgi:hypothetical protein